MKTLIICNDPPYGTERSWNGLRLADRPRWRCAADRIPSKNTRRRCLARARGLPLVQQRTAATLVTLILSLCVLVLLAAPLTWRRIVLVGAVLAGFVLLFPVPAVRRFYELQLPHSGLATTLAVAAIGAAALGIFWVLSRRRGRGPPPAVRQ
jgi:hypothetical protein